MQVKTKRVKRPQLSKIKIIEMVHGLIDNHSYFNCVSEFYVSFVKDEDREYLQIRPKADHKNIASGKNIQLLFDVLKNRKVIAPQVKTWWMGVDPTYHNSFIVWMALN